MDFKKFTSQNGWFSLTLPKDWEEYDDEDQRTCAFFNAIQWTGNLRITPFRWTDVTEPNEDKAAQFIENELQENDDAKKLKFGSFDCAYYKKDTKQNNEEFVMYYWIIGKRNNLFLCTFIIDKNQEQTDRNKSELQTVQKIIKSATI